MNAVEFKTKVENGKIDLPTPYINNISGEVRVIVLYSENKEVQPKSNKSIRGILSEYTNPELQKLEKDAWGEAMVEKLIN